MRVIRVFCLCLALMSTVGTSAQLVNKVLDIFQEDSLKKVAVVKSDSDSMLLSTIKQQLAEAKLNEANLRMEMELMKLATYAADSVKLLNQKLRIDSLRKVTPGVPVVVENDTLYYLMPSVAVTRPNNVPKPLHKIYWHWESGSTCVPIHFI